MGSAQGCWRSYMPRLRAAEALPPAPPQHWHFLCRFLLLSLPTSPGSAFPVLQQRGGAAPSSWHIRVSPTPSPLTRDPLPAPGAIDSVSPLPTLAGFLFPRLEH